MSSNPPVDVQAYGQSIWFDNISRSLIHSGELQRLVDEDGVMGVTSNPTIFMKAIAGGSNYDHTIANMLDQDATDVYDTLSIADIQNAADILRPVYERTQKEDGYVSLEVSPFLADDTDKTLSEARRLFAAVDRPNVMIKIPATEAGLPAIEDAIADGININITLIFSVDNYRQVAERYIRGLERRHEAGESVRDIASVASFFVSRIDAMVDQRLDSNIRAAQGRDLDRIRANEELLGTIAIANAKVAYQAFKEVFQGDRFASLRDAGAMVQRPLWASTSTKNPMYSSTMYVDSLIGNHTVNTVPPATLKSFKNFGSAAPTLETDVRESEILLEKLAEVGVQLTDITHMLQEDGVDSFADSFEQLIQAVEGKREMLKAGVIQRQSSVIGGYEPGVRRLIDKLGKDKTNQAIWNRDPSVWKTIGTHQEKIKNRLGWLTCVEDGCIDRQRLRDLQAESGQWSHAVVLGMGGSSLAPEVFAITFGQQEGYPELLVLDSTEPARVRAVEEAITLESTLFIVASKSGSTIETDAFRRYFYDLVVQKQGEDKAGQQFIAITDEGSKLLKIAAEHGYRDVYINPSDIGGRYSALSYFGMLPAAVMGVDIDRLYASAETMRQAIGEVIPAQGHPGIWLGALMGYLAQHGRDKLGLLFSKRIASFANWVEQLVAESTGKEGEGVLPVIAGTIGKPHDYDDDRLLVYLRLDGESEEFDTQVQTLREAGQPVFTIRLHDEYDLGGEFLRWEFATAVTGHVLGINPFDEPNVTESKDNTKALLKKFKKHGHLPREKPFVSDESVDMYVDGNTGEILAKICDQRNYSRTDLAGLLAAYISFPRSGEYFAIMAYLDPTPEYDDILSDIKRRLRHSTTRAVTIGYGPRFLHSTGQLHKGGPDSGHFLQITVEDREDLDIPGKRYSFGILEQAQAMGDQQAIAKRSRPFVRLHIKGGIADGLRRILDAIEIRQEKQR